MRMLIRTGQFKKDIKRMQKRGKAFAELKAVIENLAVGKELKAKYKDH